jgi:hypothetical protein
MMVSPLPAEKQKRRFRKDGTKFDLAETEAAVDAYDDDDEDYDDEDEDEDEDVDGDEDDDSDVAGEDDREDDEEESK